MKVRKQTKKHQYFVRIYTFWTSCVWPYIRTVLFRQHRFIQPVY